MSDEDGSRTWDALFTLDEMMDELKHHLGIHLLAREARQELQAIQQQLDELVTESYQRLQRLWHQTPGDERIDSTILPSLPNSLLTKNYARIRDLLDVVLVPMEFRPLRPYLSWTTATSGAQD
jgi:hypothetical protein